jgi:hypothetical protein
MKYALGNCVFRRIFRDTNHPTEATQTAPPPKWLQCNGPSTAKIGPGWPLSGWNSIINTSMLNVFPVPDGDTGTNMLLTMRSAYGRIQNNDDPHVGKMAEQLAHGALMGARGNSGVILSQIWRGLAKSLKGKETFMPVLTWPRPCKRRPIPLTAVS